MGNSSWVTAAVFPCSKEEAKSLSGTLALLLSEKCLLIGQRPEKISFLCTRFYFRDTQLQGVISLVSPGPSTGWRDHQGEERGFQQIECFVLQGQGRQPGPNLLFHQQAGQQWAGRNCGDGPSSLWGRLCTDIPSGEGWLPLGDLREVQLSAWTYWWFEQTPLWRAPTWLGVQFVPTQAPSTLCPISSCQAQRDSGVLVSCHSPSDTP